MQIMEKQTKNLRGNVVSQEAAVAQLARPQLDSDHGKDVDDKEEDDENMGKHGHDAYENCNYVPHTYRNKDKKMPSAVVMGLQEQCMELQ